jgi:predicted nucleic acid-binding protein
LKTFIIDASIAIKFVVEENDTPQALALLNNGRLTAPDLLVAECANILWKKVQRNELTADEASLAAQLLECVDIELLPMRGLLQAATKIALGISHPAYDCIYLALALANRTLFVTADDRLMDKLRRLPDAGLATSAVSLADVAAHL